MNIRDDIGQWTDRGLRFSTQFTFLPRQAPDPTGEVDASFRDFCRARGGTLSRLPHATPVEAGVFVATRTGVEKRRLLRSGTYSYCRDASGRALFGYRLVETGDRSLALLDRYLLTTVEPLTGQAAMQAFYEDQRAAAAARAAAPARRAERRQALYAETVPGAELCHVTALGVSGIVEEKAEGRYRIRIGRSSYLQAGLRTGEIVWGSPRDWTRCEGGAGQS